MSLCVLMRHFLFTQMTKSQAPLVMEMIRHRSYNVFHVCCVQIKAMICLEHFQVETQRF